MFISLLFSLTVIFTLFETFLHVVYVVSNWPLPEKNNVYFLICRGQLSTNVIHRITIQDVLLSKTSQYMCLYIISLVQLVQSIQFLILSIILETVCSTQHVTEANYKIYIDKNMCNIFKSNFLHLSATVNVVWVCFY